VAHGGIERIQAGRQFQSMKEVLFDIAHTAEVAFVSKRVQQATRSVLSAGTLAVLFFALAAPGRVHRRSPWRSRDDYSKTRGSIAVHLESRVKARV
jgi:hypothetical protein